MFQNAKELVFEMSITFMRECIESLSDEDRRDMRELIPLLFCEDPEEANAAENAAIEIVRTSVAVRARAEQLESMKKKLADTIEEVKDNLEKLHKNRISKN